LTSSIHQDQWLPIGEAAEKISESTRQKYSVPLLLCRALAGQLNLSVQLGNNRVYARLGYFQGRDEDAPYGISSNVREKEGSFLGIENSVFAYLAEQNKRLEGIFDLVLIGSGKTYVENLEREPSGDHGKDYIPAGGVYLEEPDGVFWEIQEEVIHHDDPLDDQPPIFFPIDHFLKEWRIVVRTSEVERFSREAIQEMSEGMRLQVADKEEQVKAQEILSKFQPKGVTSIGSLAKRWDKFGIDAEGIVKLSIERKRKIFVPVKFVSICIDELDKEYVAGASPEVVDHLYSFNVDETLYFQVRQTSLEEMCATKGKRTDHVRLIFPDELENIWGNDLHYQSRIENSLELWPLELYEKTGKDQAGYLTEQQSRKIEDLFIPDEDIASYEKEFADKKQPTANQHAPVVELKFATKLAEFEQRIEKAEVFAETGEVFRRGRQKGSIDAFTKAMLAVYSDLISTGTSKIAAQDLWDIMLKEVDLAEGVHIVEEGLDEDPNKRALVWELNGKLKKDILFNSFQARFTKVKKLAQENRD